MEYMGKVWLREKLSLEEVCSKLGMVAVHVLNLGWERDDALEEAFGVWKRPEADVFVFMHVAWGDAEAVEKIRMWGHCHGELPDRVELMEWWSKLPLPIATQEQVEQERHEIEREWTGKACSKCGNAMELVPFESMGPGYREYERDEGPVLRCPSCKNVEPAEEP